LAEFRSQTLRLPFPDTIPTLLPRPPLGLAGAAPPPDHLDHHSMDQQANPSPDNLDCRSAELRTRSLHSTLIRSPPCFHDHRGDRLAWREPLHLTTTSIPVPCSSKPLQFLTTSVAVQWNSGSRPLHLILIRSPPCFHDHRGDRLARREPLHLPTTSIAVPCSSKPLQFPTTSVAVQRNSGPIPIRSPPCFHDHRGDRLAWREPLHLSTTSIAVPCSSKPLQFPTTLVAVRWTLRTHS
jgi:hypothetical protein